MTKSAPKPKTALPISRGKHKPGLLDLNERNDSSKKMKEEEDLQA